MQTVPPTDGVQAVRVAVMPEDGPPPGWLPWYGPEQVPPDTPIEVPGVAGPVLVEYVSGPEADASALPSGASIVGPQMLEEQPRPARTTARREEAVPWSPVEVRRPTTAWNYFARGLLILVVLYVMATGLRAIFWPNGFGGSRATANQDVTAKFPTGEASQVAARFTAAYLSWDERKRDVRAEAIALDLAKGLDPGVGWSGQGVQLVRGVYPGQVKVTDAQTAHVIVLARVAPYKRSGQRWTELPAVWQRLSVPVEVGPTRVVVSGAPALVADAPGDAATKTTEQPKADDVLTTSTEKDARAFFEAYATSEEATQAITAPKAQIHSLGGSVELKELKNWTVEVGDANRRTARATVTWKVAGSATELDQDYQLTLLRTSAADGTGRWQVAELNN